MAGERTPLVTTDGQRANAPKRNVKKLLVAKIAAGVALAGALGAVYYASSGHGSEVVVSSPVSALSFGVSAITEDNWFCGEQGVEIDYIKLPHKRDDKYFYWFARSRSDTPDADPLLIWLNGGPGASSLEGLLTENGPCLVQPDLTTKRNAWAWNNNANVIWLEQPSGVGFSYVGDDADRDATGEDVGKNMYAFLEGFLDKHPEFEGRDFYLTGESYCGHYIPAASYYIWQMNKRIEERGGKKRINLQGVAIGNPDPNIPFQYQYMVEMATNNAYNLTLLNETQIAQMKKDAVECGEALKTCKPHSDAPDGCYPVASTCGDKLATPFFAAGHNRYDIRQKCSSAEECTDTDGGVVEKFLASDPVRKALYPVVGKMERGSTGTYVNHAFLDSGDWAKSYMPEITELLNDGLRMLIYAGDADLVCNWFSNRAWTLEVDWKGKQGFNAASETEFKVPEHVGTVRQYENLAFVRVFNAGHLVPKDQPHASWVMLDKFLKNEKL